MLSRARKFILEMADVPRGGDCFVAANRLALELPDDCFVVHACVDGQGPAAGHRFVHAWVEVGDVVLDYSNNRKVVVRKELYYEIGKVQEVPGQYKKYTKLQAMKNMVKLRDHGPWDRFDCEGGD